MCFECLQNTFKTTKHKSSLSCRIEFSVDFPFSSIKTINMLFHLPFDAIPFHSHIKSDLPSFRCSSIFISGDAVVLMAVLVLLLSVHFGYAISSRVHVTIGGN